MDELQVPVLVVGGSLVGLTTSALLASQGVHNLVVERHRGTAIHPRAASFHQRTMEVFRELGLQQEVEQTAEREFVQGGAIISVESLCGKELQYFYRSYNDGVEGLSPTKRLFITQVGLEPVLRARAEKLGADLRFGTEMVSFEQDDAEVRAVIRPRDGGPEQLVHARYLVGADGAHSRVREQLGIGQLGRGSFSDCITIYFKADVRSMIGDRNLSVVYVNHPDMLGFFRFSITGESGFLAVFSTAGGDGQPRVRVDGTTSDEQCREFVRMALGCGADVPIEIDNVQPWTAAASWAERFGQGRVFLAGDSAHVMPPTGGFGGNTGIADAHNLAWKLRMVLDGSADPALLDSYDLERRPAAAMTVEQAYTRYVLRVDPSLPRDDLATPLDDPSIELGAVYESGAVDRGGLPGSDGTLENPREPSGQPGTRAVHAEVERDGATVSLVDAFGGGYTMLAGPDGGRWCAAGSEAGQRLGVQVRVLRLGADLIDPEGAAAAAVHLDADGAVLVRPDGVIAWRSAANTDEPADAIEAALRGLLGRGADVPVA